MDRLSEAYRFHSCSFKVSKGKAKTARVALWKQTKIPFFFTLESSFYGFVNNERENVEFDGPRAWLELG